PVNEGHRHDKPFYYWVKLMAPSFQASRADFLGYELPSLVGLVLCIFCLRLKNVSLRYLAIYGVGTLMAYSIVHYKTPWCIISIVWPLLFVFGAVLLIVPKKYRLSATKGSGGPAEDAAKDAMDKADASMARFMVGAYYTRMG